jgi:hypothetical protein
MRTFHDAKAMAKSLKTALAARKLDLSHGECLDIVAAQFELDNWNVLSAKIENTPSGPKPATGAIQLKRAIPILRIFSVEKAKEFYLDFLGFTIDWEHRYGENFPLYAQVSRPGVALHLSEHHGDASPGSTVFVWMRGIHAYHHDLAAKDYRYYKPSVEEVEYGAWAMQVTDPFGNRLRFNEPIDPDDGRA